jgi:superfamily I DNA/RNA helicase
LFLFFDRKQGIFGSGGAQKSFHPEKILPVPAPYFPLIHNYRSTDQIVKYAQKLYPSKDNFLSHSRRQGMLPERLLYQDSEQAVAALSQRINHLVKEENVDPKDIQILSALRLDHPNSILRGKKMPHGVKASTVAAFKGLEAKIAILVNFSEHKMPFANPLMRNLLYVANTRAKHHLISVFREGCDKSEVSQKAIRSIEPAVSLVVSSDNAKSQSGTLVQVHSQQPLAVVMIEGKNVLTLLSSEQRSKLSGNIGKKVNIHVDMLEGLRFARLDAEKSS